MIDLVFRVGENPHDGCLISQETECARYFELAFPVAVQQVFQGSDVVCGAIRMEATASLPSRVRVHKGYRKLHLESTGLLSPEIRVVDGAYRSAEGLQVLYGVLHSTRESWATLVSMGTWSAYSCAFFTLREEFEVAEVRNAVDESVVVSEQNEVVLGAAAFFEKLERTVAVVGFTGDAAFPYGFVATKAVGSQLVQALFSWSKPQT